MPEEQTFSCHACGSTNFRMIVRGKTTRQHAGHGEVSMEDYACTNRGHGQFFQVVECTHCQLRALFPIPAPAQIEEAYTRVHDDEYLSIEPPRRIAFSRVLDRIERITEERKGRLLDIGCYTGVFPFLAHERGWETYGSEPSVWASDIARKRLSGNVHTGYLDTAPYPAESFDVVTAWDVVEHVTDPKKFCEQLFRLLKPGGWMFLSTMASEAPIVRLLGARWPWYMPMHLFYFTPKTLGDITQSVGFLPGRTEPYPHYTTIHYALWKLEPYLGPLSRALQYGAKATGLSEKTIKVDLGDFFLFAAQRPGASQHA